MLPHLRPVDTGEILDGAFRLYRTHSRALPASGPPPLSPPLRATGVRLAWTGVLATA